jgi:hypothetical protein
VSSKSDSLIDSEGNSHRNILADMLVVKLLEATEKNDKDEQGRAVQVALFQMDQDAMVAAWLRALPNATNAEKAIVRNRAFAAYILTLQKVNKIAAKPAVPALIKMLSASDSIDDATRAMAAKALVTIAAESENALAAVHNALGSRRYPDHLRESFALALGLVGSQRTSEMLLSVLRDPHEVLKVRYVAAVGMTNHTCSRRRLVPELMRLNRDPQFGPAARALLQQLARAPAAATSSDTDLEHPQSPTNRPSESTRATGRTIQLTCPHCGKHLRAQPDQAGKRGKCPGCGTRVQIRG